MGCKQDEKRACYSGPADSKDRGICRAGYQICNNSKWGECKEETLPSREICDGKDNNCNGEIDETDPNLEQSCNVPNTTGPCQQGTLLCKDGDLVCTPLYAPKSESCNDKDDDCDGKIDENCR